MGLAFGRRIQSKEPEQFRRIADRGGFLAGITGVTSLQGQRSQQSVAPTVAGEGPARAGGAAQQPAAPQAGAGQARGVIDDRLLANTVSGQPSSAPAQQSSGTRVSPLSTEEDEEELQTRGGRGVQRRVLSAQPNTRGKRLLGT